MIQVLISLLILISGFLFAQIEPVSDLHSNPSRVWALTNGMVHNEPGRFLKKATIILRDGKIMSLGRYIKIPEDAYEIDLEGAHVYAGFIESWLEVKKTQKDKVAQEHWNGKIRSEYQVLDDFKPDDTLLKSLHALGFTNAHIVPESGIFRGQSALVSLEKSPVSFNASVSQVLNFEYSGWSGKEYPYSLLGAIALMRQTFYDAKWYEEAQEKWNTYPEENEPIKANLSLASLAKSRQAKKPFTFMTRDEHYSLRALKILNEFNLNPWLLGNGFEYRRLKEITEMKPFIIHPLDFPAQPKVLDPNRALQYSTEQLKHWDLAKDNITRLNETGIHVAFSTHGLKKKPEFRQNLQSIIDRGLHEDKALASLTTIPAEKMGLENSLGKISPGFTANLVIVDGEYFDPKSRVVSLWIRGNEHKIAPRYLHNFKGKWSVSLNDSTFTLDFSILKGKGGKPEKLKGIFSSKAHSEKLIQMDIFESNISFSLNGVPFGFDGIVTIKGDLKKDQLSGILLDASGKNFDWQASRKKEKAPKPRKKDKASVLALAYPEGAYGFTTDPEKPNAILIDDATIWTSGPDGILEEYDILIENGIIKKMAPDIRVPKGSAWIINGLGKHITPGLIDAHNHSAAASINEGAQSVTAEVRMSDVLDGDDIALFRELAGGLTTANILHGSANPIGGQNAVIKLRWGKAPDELIFSDAPQGIKFALGENVKQANWEGSRYPQTRMGVEQVIRDAFLAAVAYKERQVNYEKNARLQRVKIPPRYDLEMEALLEILEGKRLVHCHSYRQDEIMMLIEIADEFGFTIATFQHVLEGYKIAEKIRDHGAGASTFTDWWAYKFEVYDAIPHNATLMAKNGVNVSVNSDSDELARRMNLEATKAIKYGNLSEEEALKLVTINPAQQLKIDKWVGSLEEGKDADFVVWDGPPLSVFTQCEQTWIDGTLYYSLEMAKAMEARDQALRSSLIQKILSTSSKVDGKLSVPNGEKHQGHFDCSVSDEVRFLEVNE
ncbi:MAG: amidohydrolase family protein [Candidatus Marinimicrobia bacterium]|nr:amidohydrolase family protein [Candidatus Neomarinimicrobiota bacterium]MBT3691832.1 amidohydrolase family protein [Candidatus Neomarinimicrobiota bacterium]MBT4144665.1 amidohydrolase family protein [Candidatus Neomarinimicrobiota bacterium]MBT4177938.1 amidohydrolase family protein [Candidatus Neomarinimicrobiota bacterium]MBT4594082.1 amidohydrolase family protein [Candidatus Neomarinimicrobiota bacterium]